MKPIQVARPPWDDLVVICGKCARKAGRKRFAKEVKSAAKAQIGKRMGLRVVEAGCLDLCPKRRIALATGRDLGEGRLRVVGGDQDAAAVLALLP